jgi:signal transduction histidine kinase
MLLTKPAAIDLKRTPWFLGASLAYLASAKIGFLWTLQPLPFSMLWFPNAILLAALLLTPPREWWCLILVVLPVHSLIELSEGVPLVMTLAWFFTNTFEALFAAFLIIFFLGKKPDFEIQRDAGVFLLFGAGVSPFISSHLDVMAVQIFRFSDDDYWLLWRSRFLSNSLSMLVIVPLILSIAGKRAWRRCMLKDMSFLFEGVALMVVVATISMVLCNQLGLGDKAYLLIAIALIPAFFWAALRFGSGYVSALFLLVTLTVSVGARSWMGGFDDELFSENIMLLQILLIFSATSILFLTSIACEWREAKASSNASLQQLNMTRNCARITSWKIDLTHGSRLRTQQLNIFDGENFSFAEFLQMIHLDDQAAVAEALNAAIKTGVPYKLELRISRDGVNYDWVESYGVVRRNSQGRATYILGNNIDISHKKAQELQSKQQREDLAHLSRVAMLGEMSGAIAHELNQPLTSILSNAQAAQRILQNTYPRQSGIDDILQDIVSENKRAGEIIVHMRELLKKGGVRFQTVDINKIVLRAIKLEHSYLISRNIVVATDFDKHLPLALADSVQVQQVILNLMINASDAMSKNPISARLIRISTRRDHDDFVRISVSDCGEGISAESAEAIFEPFFTTKAQGLGLGLAICRSIVSAHSGQLIVTDNVSGGATFHVTLPAATESFEDTLNSCKGVA